MVRCGQVVTKHGIEQLFIEFTIIQQIIFKIVTSKPLHEENLTKLVKMEKYLNIY